MIVADTLDEATSLAPKISGFANGWYVIKHWLLASEMDAFDSAVAKIDVVVIASDVLNRAEVARRAARHGKLVLIAPRPYELTLFGAQPHYLDDCMMLSIEQHRLENGDLLVKRLMDVVISLDRHRGGEPAAAGAADIDPSGVEGTRPIQAGTGRKGRQAVPSLEASYHGRQRRGTYRAYPGDA